MTKSFFAALIFAPAFACGGGTLPPAQSANVQAEIKAAETVRAADDPKAALHLKLAKDQYAQAEKQADNGDDDEAKLTLARAAADAELAVALAKNVEEQKQSDAANAKLKELDSSNSQKGVN